MLEFLAASENTPFTVALVVMFGIAILEGITPVFGAGFSGLIESMLPEADLDFDADAPDYQSPTPLSRLLGWLRVGEVPVLMLLVLFLTGFGLMGLALQSYVQQITGTLLPGALAAVPAFAAALPAVRVGAGVLAKILPKDETDAVSEDSLVGRVATLTLGTARLGSPAQAKVRDTRGTTHYVMVEPDGAGEFSTHTEVLLVRRAGAVFKAIANPSPVLTDTHRH